MRLINKHTVIDDDVSFGQEESYIVAISRKDLHLVYLLINFGSLNTPRYSWVLCVLKNGFGELDKRLEPPIFSGIGNAITYLHLVYHDNISIFSCNERMDVAKLINNIYGVDESIQVISVCNAYEEKAIHTSAALKKNKHGEIIA